MSQDQVHKDQAHQFVHRFLGGPPLAVLGRLILLSILVGVILAAIGLDPWTAVAVATHDAELDLEALLVALPSAAFYVGALGARRRTPERRAALVAADLSMQDIARLHAPIGLDIGGKAPWEVALAVLAEITRERVARAEA